MQQRTQRSNPPRTGPQQSSPFLLPREKLSLLSSRFPLLPLLRTSVTPIVGHGNSEVWPTAAAGCNAQTFAPTHERQGTATRSEFDDFKKDRCSESCLPASQKRPGHDAQSNLAYSSRGHVMRRRHTQIVLRCWAPVSRACRMHGIKSPAHEPSPSVTLTSGP